MRLKRKWKAFSLVELMMLLLVSSLIVAALVPVVTKKHFRLPSVVTHGAYMCYYKNGQLRETKWAGKAQQNVVFDRSTDNCVFVPPQKAAFFQISAIGGGGGGGDAGYTGGTPEAGWEAELSLSPFGIDTEKLLEYNIIPDASTTSEFMSYVGSLWGYARGGDSSSGGDAGAARKIVDEKICLEPVYETTTETVCSYTRYVSGSGEKCYLKEKEGSTPSSPSYCYVAVDHDVDTTTCDYREIPRETTNCVDPYCTNYHTECHDVTVNKTKQECETKTVDTPGFQITCRDGTSYCSSTSVIAGGSSTCRTTGSCTITSQKQECKNIPYTETETQCSTGECLNWTERECTTTEWTEYQPYNCVTTTTTETDVQVDNCGDYDTDVYELVCEDGSVSGYYCAEYEDITETTQVDCNEWEYIYAYPVSTVYGASGASGAQCTTSTVTGGLGLGSSFGSDVPNSPPANGSDLEPTSGTLPGYIGIVGPMYAGDGMASCVGGPAASCGSQEGATSSFASISKNGSTSSTRAYSAWQGGGGAGRTCSDNGSGECVDSGLSPQFTSRGGSCSSDGGNSLCGTGWYGYCLEHHYGTVEDGGNYSYRYSYDKNYLQYGKPGSPGVFKTIIVRSLKDIDTTIKIGRGGSAAAFNLGQKGANGSPTSMGSILHAEGGEGGEGKQLREAQVLPKYHAATYEKEHLCYNKDKFMNTKNEDGTWAYPAERAQLLGKPTTYCDDLTASGYKYHIVAGRTFGEFPTPIGIASSVMHFVFDTADSSDAIKQFTKFGRGGAGGGVEHRCWAGQWKVEFEGELMLKTSVFPTKEEAQSVGGKFWVPNNCHEDWDNVAAGPGVDGALLIKW